MDGSDEYIVITTVTEKTTYGEMSEREKRIYDHAYSKGFEKGEGRYHFFYVGLTLFIISCIILFKSWLP